MKTLALIILLMIPVLIANYLSMSIKRRIRLLEAFLMLIKMLKNGIGFSQQPITEFFKSAQSNKEFAQLSFLNDLNTELSKGVGFDKAWCDSINAFARKTSITDSDASVLCAFASQLGGTDVSGQLENCDMFYAILEERTDRLKKEADNKIKVYNSIGLLAAAFVTVLFI